MQWWNDLIDWLNSDVGWRIVSGAIIPFVAIVVAGIIAAAVGRGSTKRAIALSDREVRTSAVTALITSARKATTWNTLSIAEQQHYDALASEADIRIRLLPINGTALAGDWAAHEITEMKKNSVSFSFQAEQSLLVFRDRLAEWLAHPSRARRLFKSDLDTWAYESSLSDQELVHQQQAWAAQQTEKRDPLGIDTAALASAPEPNATDKVDDSLFAPASATAASKRIDPISED